MDQLKDQAFTEARRQVAQLEELGYYHSIELPDGTALRGFQSVEHLHKRLAQFPIPDDLRGKRVLDIGAWDGWFTFEMERRGAQVVALDLVKNDKFFELRDLLGSRAEYVVGDISRLTSKDLGRFDIVLFLGVLYHLKHPLLALENVCDLTTGLACVESFVTDDGKNLDARPALEFYEGVELRGQFDNWVGPNVPCLLAMARAAGFAEVKFESVLGDRAHVTCRRNWLSTPGTAAPPTLICVENSVSRDHSFSLVNDDYVSLWFESQESRLDCNNVFVEIGPFAARPAQVVPSGSTGWHAVCKLPPGLDPGWHSVRVRVTNSVFSNDARIPVGLTQEQRRLGRAGPYSNTLKIQLITDGNTWERWRVKVGSGSTLSMWTTGIPLDCKASDIEVLLDESVLPATYLSGLDSEGLRQVNAMLPPGFRPKAERIQLACRGEVSEPVDIALV